MVCERDALDCGAPELPDREEDDSCGVGLQCEFGDVEPELEALMHHLAGRIAFRGDVVDWGLGLVEPGLITGDGLFGFSDGAEHQFDAVFVVLSERFAQRFCL